MAVPYPKPPMLSDRMCSVNSRGIPSSTSLALLEQYQQFPAW
jgi:hypothetical protein